MLLVVSRIAALNGIFQLRPAGKPTDQLEATTQLVTKGIYRYFRHPLYASLIYLARGIFFKSPFLIGSCICSSFHGFLFATARADESECLAKFGDEYAGYVKKTKMFILFVI
jgi:protein-S-isoprenylcysteine O-methyltransferase Ste14